MTLQKAMRVRSELKKEITNLNALIQDYPSKITFKDKYPGPEELNKKRNEKSVALDEMTYEDVIKKILLITDTILDLNIAIEKVNREGHNLLFKETTIKTKIATIEFQIDIERNIVQETETLDYDYEHTDDKGIFRRVKVINYNFPILTEKTFGMSLVAYKKQLTKELESVRDEISAFNASKKN